MKSGSLNLPVYSYSCSCGNTFKDLKKPKEQSKCSKCGTMVSQSIPSNGMTVIMESLDPTRNVKTRKGVQAQIKDRMTKHHDQYEIADKIDEHGIKDAVKHGWVRKGKRT